MDNIEVSVVKSLAIRDPETGWSYLLGMPLEDDYDLPGAVVGGCFSPDDIPLHKSLVLQLPSREACDVRGVFFRGESCFMWSVGTFEMLAQKKRGWRPVETFAEALDATIAAFRKHISNCRQCSEAPNPGPRKGNPSDALMCGNCGDVLWSGNVAPSPEVARHTMLNHSKVCEAGRPS